MARFYGTVGYVVNKELRPGVWSEVAEEHNYYGETKKLYVKWGGDGKPIEDISPTNQIRILADEFAFKNAGAIRYVNWMGTCWKVVGLEIEHPRITLTLGGVYNGKKIAASG